MTSYVGSGGHADDIRTIAANKSSLMSQTLLVRDFTKNTCLKLNVAKCDVVRMTGRSGLCGEKIDLASHTVETQDKAKCLGIWLRCDLSAKTSVKENIIKARRAFFGMGKVGAFQGTLTPLSGASIYDACVIPVLLYGCETWILDHPCLTVLENFQAEIGKRILHPPPRHPNNAVQVGLQWPSVASRILIHKLTYLAKLMTSDNQISAKLFSSLVIEDIYQISIVQQCKLLEVSLGTSVLARCLSDPLNAPRIVKEHRSIILKQDFESLLVSASSHQSTKHICNVARITSWRKVWDYALDRGARGTKLIQILFKAMSTPVFGTRSCTLCGDHIDLNCSFLDHLCEFHLKLKH